LKVLQVIAAVADRYGGPSRNVVGLCAATRAAGVDAEICATDADGPGASLPVAGSGPQDWRGVPVRFFHRRWSERYKISPPLARWLRTSARSYDLVVVHGCFSHVPEAAAMAARRAGVPYIVVPHGMLSDWALRRPAKRVYFRLRVRTLVRHASGFLCTSVAEQDEVARCGGLAPSISISWGIEPELFVASPADRVAWKQALGLPPSCRAVLFLGRLHPKKGIVDQLLPALTALPDDIAAVIAGSTDPHAPEYADAIRSEVSRLGLGARVHFTGTLKDEAKIAAVDACDVFVLPSRSENFGVAVAEAMARARPVVVSEQVQIAEDLSRVGAAVVAKLDPQSLAAAIAKVLDDPDGARRMGEAGRRFAAERFSWNVAGKQARRFYEDVVAQRAGRLG
jgi:glycosyltransferase involved in cell wall biosynthesis